MKLKYDYYYYKEKLSPEVCQKIIDLGISKLQENRAKGLSTSGATAGKADRGSVLQENGKAIALANKTLEEVKSLGLKPDGSSFYVRDSEVAWLNDQWLYDLILPLTAKANFDAGWNFDVDYYEDFQFTVYHNAGFYGWHSDGGSDHHGKFKRYIPGISPTDENGNMPPDYSKNPKIIGKVRKLSLTINLNKPEDYEGGELQFDFGPHAENERFQVCDEIKPQGSMIVFPSFVPHQVTPVTRGTRFSLVLWQLGNPFK